MADYDDSPQDIEIVLPESTVTEFNHKMHEIFYSTRPGYDECMLRCTVLNLMNGIWQQYLIEKEQNAMINKSNKKYGDIITDKTSIEIVDIEGQHEPYRKFEEAHSSNTNPISSDGSDSPNDHDQGPTTNPMTSSSTNPIPTTSNPSSKSPHDRQREVWCTPIEGKEQEIIIRETENGPIVKKIRIPSVMIFGSIAFGLDGRGSDIDLALPAGIDMPAVNAHQDGKVQVKLLKEFMNRLKLNMSSWHRLGLEWKMEPILHARVPIVKLTEMKMTQGALNVDIGIRSTQMPITKLISYYCAYDDRVAVFYMFIKQWSKQRRISDAMYGFPNSFGFVMLATKFLQLTEEPVIPIVDYDRKMKRIQVRHSLRHFRRNEQTLLELAVAFFDFYASFDFETYQISITTAGLQWKHPNDYNLNHDDQGTMLIEDPSANNENVTRCLKPYNMRIMKQEFFRAFKCSKHADWDLLFKPYNDRGEPSIFEIYPPEDEWEENMRYEIEAFDNDWEYEHYLGNGYDDNESRQSQYAMNTRSKGRRNKNSDRDQGQSGYHQNGSGNGSNHHSSKKGKMKKSKKNKATKSMQETHSKYKVKQRN